MKDLYVVGCVASLCVASFVFGTFISTKTLFTFEFALLSAVFVAYVYYNTVLLAQEKDLLVQTKEEYRVLLAQEKDLLVQTKEECRVCEGLPAMLVGFRQLDASVAKYSNIHQ